MKGDVTGKDGMDVRLRESGTASGEGGVQSWGGSPGELYLGQLISRLEHDLGMT